MASLLSQIDAESPYTKFAAAGGVIVIVAIVSHLFSSLRVPRALSRYPIINERWDDAAKKNFTESASKIVQEGSAMVSNNANTLFLNDSVS